MATLFPLSQVSAQEHKIGTEPVKINAFFHFYPVFLECTMSETTCAGHKRIAGEVRANILQESYSVGEKTLHSVLPQHGDTDIAYGRAGFAVGEVKVAG